MFSAAQRVIAFGITFTIGIILSFMATIAIFDPVRFSLLYSFGNLISLLSCVGVCPMESLAVSRKACTCVSSSKKGPLSLMQKRVSNRPVAPAKEHV